MAETRGPRAREGHTRGPGLGAGLHGAPPDVPPFHAMGWTRAFSTVDETMSARSEEAEALLIEKMPPALSDAICHGETGMPTAASLLIKRWLES